MTLLYRLFNTHFQILPENELDQFEFSQNHLNAKYYAKDFEVEDDEMSCGNCHSMFPLKKGDKEITELFGNSVLDIETKATCNCCGHFNHNHIRFKKGYVIKMEDDVWMCVIPKHSIISEWFYTIKRLLTTKELE